MSSGRIRIVLGLSFTLTACGEICIAGLELVASLTGSSCNTIG